MALSSMLSMRPLGQTFLADPENKSEDLSPVSDACLSEEQQRAFVMIVGNGLLSHWATVWVFANGAVFVVELLARDLETGERWGESDFHMQQIHAGGPEHQNESSEQADDVRIGTVDGIRLYRALWQSALPSQDRLAVVKQCRTCLLTVERYLLGLGYRILSPSRGMRIDTSPAELYAKAQAVPLNGSQYDLLFHNCQLWVVMLLNDGYSLDFRLLPFTIGSLVAGPLLDIVELSFLGIYLGLQHITPVVSLVFGTLWFALLVWFSWLYGHRAPKGTFPWEVVIGACILLGVPFFDRSASLAGGLPFITLAWDLVVVCQSMRQTKVFESPFLMVWNFGMTVVSVVVATVAQTHYGVHAAPAVVNAAVHCIASLLSPMAGVLWHLVLLLAAAVFLIPLLYSLVFLQPHAGCSRF